MPNLRQAGKITLFVACCLLILPKAFAQHGQVPQGVLLASLDQIEEDPYFEWILRQERRGGPIEGAKIEYLIERIRKSDYRFIRNNVEYPSSEAANHLSWKYGLGRKSIRTAHDFIKHIASRSLNSGLRYLIKFPNGEKIPTEEILENELRILEASLEQNQPLK